MKNKKEAVSKWQKHHLDVASFFILKSTYQTKKSLDKPHRISVIRIIFPIFEHTSLK